MRCSAKIGISITILFCALFLLVSGADVRAQDRCISWSEARSAGLTEKFKLRSASEIKADVEKRYGGKVVSFQICRDSDALIYKLAVFKSNGNVLFVTEPAEPAEAAKAVQPEKPASRTGN